MPFWEWLGFKSTKTDAVGRKNGNGGNAKGQKKPQAPPKAISDPSDWVEFMPKLDEELPAGAGAPEWRGMTGRQGRPLTAQELRIMNKRVAETGAMGTGWALTEAQKRQALGIGTGRPVWVDEEWRHAGWGDAT